jgi:hypothetical protein
MSAQVLVLLLVLAQRASGPAAGAQEEWDVDFTANPVFARQLTYGWQPFFVTLANRTPRDLELSLEMEQSAEELRVRRRLVLPAGATQQFFVYGWTRPGLPDEFTFRLVDSNGRPVGAPQSHSYGAGWSESDGLLVLTRAEERDGLLGLPTEVPSRVSMGTWNNQAYRPRCILRPERLPDRAAALDNIHAIILHDCPIEAFNADQRRALRDYVGGGGTLVVVPGVDREWLNDPFLQEFLPGPIKDSHTVTELPALQNAAFSRATVTQNGQVVSGPRNANSDPLRSDTPIRIFEPAGGNWVVGAGGEPLVVESPYGAGTVLFVATDLNRRPINKWNGTEILWSDALGFQRHARAADANQLLWQDLELLRAGSSNLRRTPPILMLLALTLCYALAVGPAHLILMRKLKRPMLALGTIPAVAAAFVGIILLSGMVYRGTASVSQQLQVMVSRSEDRIAQERVLFALHASSDRPYDIEAPPGVWLTPLTPDDNVRALIDQAPTTMSILQYPMGQWQTRFFAGRRALPVGGGVRIEPSERGFRVANLSPFRVRAAALVDASGGIVRTFSVGALEPGDAKTCGGVGGLEGFRPVEAMGLSRDDLIGRALSDWNELSRHVVVAKRAGAQQVTFYGVVERAVDPVKAGVGRQESGALWVVRYEPPAEAPR